MAMQCPTCTYQNPDQSTFCVRCGQQFFQQNAQFQQSSQFAPPAFPAPSPSPAFSTPNAPPAFSAPSASLAFPTPNLQQGGASVTASPAVVPIGGAQGNASLRRAFAGHGKPVMHQSWLLDGKHVQATTLNTTIVQRLFQRNVTGLTITPEKLMERGVLTEERDYVRVKRSVSTVFVYVAPAGQDLYISRATVVQPAISNFRAIFFTVLAAIAVFGPMLVGSFINNSMASSMSSPYNPSSSAISPLIGVLTGLFSLFFLSPIYLFLGIVLVRAIIYWIFEKDFWVFLRPSVLNDFQLDDIALMEHVTDETIRDSVQELGLDASKIAPPEEGYRPKRRIRMF